MPIDGRFDHLSQRVDLDVWHQLQTHRAMGGVRPEDEAAWQAYEQELLAKLVIDHQPDPPQPASEYEWIHDVDGKRVRRWQKTAEVQARDRADAQARAEIARLESQQPRAMRELMLEPNNTDAIQRLDAINQRIAELRPHLKR